MSWKYDLNNPKQVLLICLKCDYQCYDLESASEHTDQFKHYIWKLVGTNKELCIG